MRYNILVGGEAGQGINTIAELISKVLTNLGYYVFNYNDYPSLIRGGHNFNIVAFSNNPISSFDSKIDILLSIDEKTEKIHKKNLNKKAIVIKGKNFEDLEKNKNIAVLGFLFNYLGIEKEKLKNLLEEKFDNKDIIKAGDKGYDFFNLKKRLYLKELKNKINYLDGSKGVALGAINSDLNYYFAYPMTPATGVMKELAISEKYEKNSLKVIQPENEIAVINSGLGASYAGANVMIGTSGGGFDLMSEGISLQGMAEVPLVIYLASRSGPASGVPTYTSQADLDIALRAGHGEFPRIVIAPGDALECIEKTNEAFYLSNKFNCLSIIFSDKLLAESYYSFSEKFPKFKKIKFNRNIPGKENFAVKVSSYESDKKGNTTEKAEIIEKNANFRLEKYNNIKKECEKFEMFKIYGNKKSKNLIIGFGSVKGAIIDSIQNLDCKFLQILYIKPMSKQIKKELEKSKNLILVENNLTGQLGRLIREKTGIKIPEKSRILKYDARPFFRNELKKEIKKRLK